MAKLPENAPQGQTPAPSAAHGGAVLGLVLAGGVCIVLADYAPHLVNGVLALILAGVILGNEARWVPAMQALVNALGKNKVAA